MCISYHALQVELAPHGYNNEARMSIGEKICYLNTVAQCY